jgi:hypothetical protein
MPWQHTLKNICQDQRHDLWSRSENAVRPVACRKFASRLKLMMGQHCKSILQVAEIAPPRYAVRPVAVVAQTTLALSEVISDLMASIVHYQDDSENAI